MNNIYNALHVLKCSNSVHFHSSVLHYLYTMADGLVIYAKARAFKAKANICGLKAKTKAKEYRSCGKTGR